MITLGIETSCDETSVSLVQDGTDIISNVVASSQELHIKTGGIIPEIAAREQLASMTSVLSEALEQAGLQIEDVDRIAVTYGPGLIGSLLVGVETAKTLAMVYGKPIFPVNHLVGHIYANWLEGNKPTFPAIALVVSGGHTDLVYMEKHGEIQWIGGTRDDAAGEAFDKTARILGLPYPGGPSISKAAEEFYKANPGFKFELFPRPMISEDSFDFSFSGLKTSVNRFVKDNQKEVSIEQIAAEVQEAIVDVLVAKTKKAIVKYHPKSLLLSGGVAANSRLREEFENEIKREKLAVNFFVPSPKLCTDNASYIAAASYFIGKGTPWQFVDPDPQLTINE